jgi:dihydrofolate reductase
MRKLVVLQFLSLDGVIQAPGGPDEDKSSGFKYGGWVGPLGDKAFGDEMDKQITPPFDLLLGRKTYELFASYWPKQDAEKNPFAGPFSNAKKYVVSNTSPELSWKETELIDGDVVAKLKELKQGDGPMVQVHGSANLVQTLLKEDLVDELWLKFFPVTLGPGKRLFEDGSIPATWELTESTVTTTGVIMANYKRAGELKLAAIE